MSLSCVLRKLAFCKCENKGADQLRSYHAADLHLCFCCIDIETPLLPKFEISNLWPSLGNPGRFGPGSFRPESFRPGSFRPNLGVGRFGLGRWVDSALGRFGPGSFRPKIYR